MNEPEALLAKIEKQKRTIRRWEICAFSFSATFALLGILSHVNTLYVRHKLQTECDRYQAKAD